MRARYWVEPWFQPLPGPDREGNGVGGLTRPGPTAVKTATAAAARLWGGVRDCGPIIGGLSPTHALTEGTGI